MTRDANENQMTFEVDQLTGHNNYVGRMISSCSTLSEERKFAKSIYAQIGGPRDLRRVISGLASSGKPAARRLACHLIRLFHGKYGKEVPSVLLILANDPDWRVREEAAWALSRVLEGDFDRIVAIYKRWSLAESDEVQRAIAVAAKRVGQSRRPEFAEGLFDLLEPLMANRSQYVRKNLGPYALGDGLLVYYPEQGFSFLRKCMKSNNQQVRWNIAMSLSSTAGMKNTGEAIEILTELALDNRRYVWRSVASAMRKLALKRPSDVLPVIEEWSGDERRRHIALIVEKYVDTE